jgi:hypothetical protein
MIDRVSYDFHVVVFLTSIVFCEYEPTMDSVVITTLASQEYFKTGRKILVQGVFLSNTFVKLPP